MSTMRTKQIILFMAVWIFSCRAAFASSSGVTYHGRILEPDGVTPISGVVEFKIEIHSPGATNCIMYAETQTQDLTTSNGIFALTIGDGTRYGYQGLTLDKVFSNGSSFDLSGSTCIGATTYTPAISDPRELYVWFQSPSMSAFEQMPQEEVNYAPLAIESQQVSGFKATSLLRVDGTVANTSPLNNTQYTELLALMAGTSTHYSQSSTVTGTEIVTASGNVTTPTLGSMWLDTSTNTIKVYTSGGVETVATSLSGNFLTGITAGPGVSVTTSGSTATVGIGTSAITNSMLADGSVTASKLASASVTASALDPAIVISTTGTVSANGVASKILTLSNSQSPVDSTHNEVSLIAPGSAFAAYTLTLPTALGSNGQVLTTDASGILHWSTVGVGTSMPSIASGQIYVGSASNTPAAVTPTGDVSLTNAGALTVNAIQNVGVGTSAPSASGQVLRYDQTSTKYQPAFLSMADIRSVAMPGLTIFPTTSCTASQVLNWSSLTDQFTCTTISISATNVSGLGSAAFLNVGVGSNSVVQLDSSAKLPAVDGSQLTNLNATALASGTINPTLLPASASIWALSGTNAYNTNAGFVGIGTTAPVALLHLANNNIGILRVDTNNVTNSSQLQLYSGHGTAAAPTESLKDDALGSVVFFGQRTGGSVSGAQISGRAGEDWTGSGRGTYLQFSTKTVGGSTMTERMRLDPSGNLGIGTTSPAYKLDVAGDINTSGAFRINGTAISAGSANAWTQSGSNVYPTTATAIGIGTTAPAYLVDATQSLDGDVSSFVTNPSTGVNARAFIGASNGTSSLTMAMSGTAYSSSSDYRTNWGTLRTNGTSNGLVIAAGGGTAPIAFDAGGAERVRILAGGSVGFGTTAPTSTVHIYNGTETIERSTGDAVLAIAKDDAAVTNTLFGLANTGSSSSNRLSIFTNTSAVFAGGSEKMTILNSGNVGIGTTSPAYKLDVAGDINTSGAFRINGTAISAGSANAWTQSGSNVYPTTATAIGIGTTAPVSPLHVAGVIRSDSNFTVTGAGALGASGSNLIASTVAGGNFQVTNASFAPQLTVTQAGNVGIGTTAPGTALDVGPGKISGGTNSATPTLRTTLDLSSYASRASALFTFPTAASISLQDTSRIATHDASLLLSGATASDYGIVEGTGSAGLAVETNNSTPVIFRPNLTEAMRITAAGNVGIGTTAPAFKLDVNGAINATAINLNGSPLASDLWQTNGTDVYRTAGKIGLGTSAPTYALDITGTTRVLSAATNGTNLAIQNTDTGGRQFTLVSTGSASGQGPGKFVLRDNTGTSDRLTVDSSGNVGIGTTAPTLPLFVYGTNAVAGFGDGTNGSAYTSVNGRAWFGFNGARDMVVVQGVSSKGIQFNVNNNTFGSGTAMTLDTSGNVGIGTTSPSYKLDVAGAINATSLLVNGVAVGTGGSSPWASNGSNIYPSTLTNSVGIGTTTPAVPLDVVGAANVSGNLTVGSGSNGIIKLGTVTALSKSGNAFAVGGSFSNNYLQLMTDGGEKVRIDTSGNVGIGTTTPAYPLDVNGSMNVAASSVYKIGGSNALTMLSNSVGVGQAVATAGNKNVYVGYQAGQSGTGGYNVAVGFQALRNSTTGSNTAIGNQALYAATSGGNNTAFGSGALIADLTGANNVALGANALAASTNDNNIAVGTGAASNLTAGSNNIIIGNSLSAPNATGSNQMYLGGVIYGDLAATNVGIGTTAPSYKLDVAGDINTTGTFRINGTALSTSGANAWTQTGNSTYPTSATNIGIGTTNPINPLDVTGNAAFGNSIGVGVQPSVVGSSGNTFKLGVNTTAIGTSLDVSNYNVGTNAYGAYITRAGAATNGVGLYVNSANATNNYAALFMGGNVGIGTTTPAYPLQIVGSVAGGAFKVTSFGSASGVNYGPTAGTYGMFMPAANVTAFSANSSEAMRIDSSGNVGIGTTAPAYKLDVNGTINATSLLVNGVAVGTGTSSPWTTNGTNIYNTTLANNVGIGTTAPVYPLDVAGNMHASGYMYMSGTNRLSNAADAQVGVNFLNATAPGAGYVNFVTANSNRMTIDNTGKVGIGTTSPGVALDVNGTVNAALASGFTIGGFTAISFANANNSNTSVGYATAGNTGTSNTIMGYQAGRRISTGGSNTFVGSSAGGGNISAPTTGGSNVGLGASALTVCQGACAQNTALGASALAANTTATLNAAVGYQAGSQITTGNNNVVIGPQVGTVTLSTGSNNILIGTNNGVDASSSSVSNTLNIGNAIFATGLASTGTTPTGNVGIGTTAPAYKLQVAGQVDATAFSIGGVPITGGGASAWAVNGTNIYSTNSGNVGIGTDTPSVQLHLKSSSASNLELQTVTGYDSAQIIFNRAGTQSYFGPSNSSFDWFSNEAIPLTLGTNGAQRMVVLPSGNVGIGTTAPTHLVEVAGTLSASGNVTFTSPTASTNWTNGAVTLAGGLGASGSIYSNGALGGGKLVINGSNGVGYNPAGSGTAPTSFTNGGSITTSSSGGDGTGSGIVFSGVNSATSTQQGYIGITTQSSGYTPAIVFGQQTGSSAYAERMRIDPSGNVGIGTTAPAAKLHILGTLLTETTSGNPTIAIGKDDAAVTNNFVGLANTGASGSNRLSFFTNTSGNFSGATEQMVIMNTGNVGIGTAAPDTTLHVNGSIKMVDGNQANGKVMTSDANGVAIWRAPAQAAIPTSVQTAAYTVTTADIGSIIFMNATADKTVTLPAAATAGAGFKVTIKNINTAYVYVSPTPTGCSSTYFYIYNNDSYMELVSTGSAWVVLGRNGATCGTRLPGTP